MLAPGTTYGFDITVNGNGNDYPEWLGTGSDVFSGGAAYNGSAAGKSGGPDNALNMLAGDRVFLVQLLPIVHPTLAIQLVSSNQVQMSWPASATGFILQSSPNVTGPWGYAGLVVTNQNGTNVAMAAINGSTMFYQLLLSPGLNLIPVVSCAERLRWGDATDESRHAEVAGIFTACSPGCV